MGSQVLKLLLTTWNFWLLSPSSSSELLLPSLVMAMAVTGTEDTVEATMVATEDTTTARGRLMLSPPPPLSPDMVTTAMDMDTALTDTAMLLLTPTDIMVTTARGPLMLSPDMATTATDTDTATDTATDTDTEDTEDTTTERGPLMLSPDMATTAMDTEDTAEDTTVMVMVMATDTTVEKFQKLLMLIHQIRVQYK